MGMAIRIHVTNDGGDPKTRAVNDAHRPARLYAKADARASHTHRLGKPPETMGTKDFQSPRSSSPSWVLPECADVAEEFVAATTEPAKSVRNVLNANLGDISRGSLQHLAG